MHHQRCARKLFHSISLEKVKYSYQCSLLNVCCGVFMPFPLNQCAYFAYNGTLSFFIQIVMVSFDFPTFSTIWTKIYTWFFVWLNKLQTGAKFSYSFKKIKWRLRSPSSIRQQSPKEPKECETVNFKQLQTKVKIFLHSMRYNRYQIVVTGNIAGCAAFPLKYFLNSSLLFWRVSSILIYIYYV